MSAPALAPEVALAYLRGLSADLREAAVLDADGAVLAGSPELAETARALLGADGGARTAEHRGPEGVLLAARSPARAIVALYGPLVLVGLARHDLRRVVSELG